MSYSQSAFTAHAVTRNELLTVAPARLTIRLDLGTCAPRHGGGQVRFLNGPIGYWPTLVDWYFVAANVKRKRERHE